MPPLLQRLKERKIVQWAVVYLAGAWLFLEALGFVADNFGWPSYITRSAIVLAGVGFFAALVLAWYHGEKGRQRASGLELLILTGILVIAGLLVTVLKPRAGGEPEVPERSTVAVSESGRPSVAALPFDHWSGLEEDRWFTDGMHEQILTQLSKIGGLSVRGRTSAMEYRDSPKNLRQIGRELNARYVLEGSVFREGETVRINVQLMDALEDEHLWAENYDRDLSVESLLAVQSDIAERVAQSLRAELTPDERARIEARPTDNLQAYDLYLLGRYYWSRFGQEDIERAIEYFDQAIAEDPDYALAHAGLADAYLMLALGHGTGAAEPGEMIRKAKEAVSQALEIDPELSEARQVLGLIKHTFDYEYAEAERELRQAVELSPSNAHAHNRLGVLLLVLGRFDEAISAIRSAHELDPLSPIITTDLGWTLHHAGRSDEAAEQARALIDRFPDFVVGYELLCDALAFQGEYERAIATCETAWTMSENPLALAFLARANALNGNQSEARRIEAQMKDLARERYVSPLDMARLYAGIGEDELAIEWLRRCVEMRVGWISGIGVDRTFENLRMYPEFQELLARLNLN